MPASCPSWIRKIGGGGRTKAVMNFYVQSICLFLYLVCLCLSLCCHTCLQDILGTEGASEDDENEDEEIELARASLSFRNDSYMEDMNDDLAGDLGLGDRVKLKCQNLIHDQFVTVDCEFFTVDCEFFNHSAILNRSVTMAVGLLAWLVLC